MEVAKPFPQEEELREKLDRLAELNALLNMDEKGDSAVAMEDAEGENTESDMETRENRVAEKIAKPVASWTMSERIAEYEKSRMMADKGTERISVKEKLNEMRQKVCEQKNVSEPDLTKNKGKEESL